MSKYDKVYMFDFYRILSVKKRFWSFKSAKDIRPCMSTLLKFLEAVMPFIKDKVKGVLMTMPASTEIKKYHKLLSFGLRKSYLKIFNAVEAQHSPDSKINQFNNFMFLIKKGADPKQLFKTSMFKKNYTFGYLDTEFLDTVEPKIFQKDTVSLKIDKKYAFGKMEVNLIDTVDVQEPQLGLPKKYTTQDLLKLTGKPVVKDKITGSGVDVNKLTQDKFEKFKIDAIAEPIPSILSVKEYKSKEDISDIGLLEAPASIMSVIINLRSYKGLSNDKMKDVPFTKMKEHIEYSYKNKASEDFKNLLMAAKVFDKNGTLVFNHKDFEEATRKIYDMMDGSLTPKLFGEVQQSGNSFYKVMGKYIKYSVKTDDELKFMAKQEAESEAGVTAKIKKIPDAVRTKIDMPVEIKSTVPGFDTINSYEDESPLTKGTYGDTFKFNHENENVSLKMGSVLAMPEVNTWYEKFETIPGKLAVRKYCGSESGAMNQVMKDFSMGLLDAKDLSDDVKKMVKYFIKESPALERGIWVYRNGRIGNIEKGPYSDINFNYDDIKAGAQFTNATIMSTSIRSSQQVGSSRMKHLIYLPAGTRCLPVFAKVTHSGENEILLPPMSTFKIIDCWDYRPEDYPMFLIKSIYIGSSVESLQDMITNGGKLDEKQKAVTEAEEYIRKARERFYGK